MSDDTWDQLAAMTARIEKLRGDRKIARYVGNLELRDEIHSEIEDLLGRRERLIDELSKDASRVAHVVDAD